MNFLNNLKETHIRGLLALMVVASVIIGFFMGVVPLEMFSALSGAVLTYYYQGNRIVQLEKAKENAEAELQSVVWEQKTAKDAVELNKWIDSKTLENK